MTNKVIWLIAVITWGINVSYFVNREQYVLAAMGMVLTLYSLGKLLISEE